MRPRRVPVLDAIQQGGAAASAAPAENGVLEPGESRALGAGGGGAGESSPAESAERVEERRDQ